MDLLKRELAPILPDAWKLIDAEATRVLRLNLAGRKLVDFKGPFGWTYAAVNTGRLHLFDQQPIEGVSTGMRVVQPSSRCGRPSCSRPWSSTPWRAGRTTPT